MMSLEYDKELHFREPKSGCGEMPMRLSESLEGGTYGFLRGEASLRGVTVQRPLLSPVRNDQFHVVSNRNLHSSRSASQGRPDINATFARVERLSEDKEERVLVLPLKAVHSIEDYMLQTFGSGPSASFLYEMGKHSGKWSMSLLERSGHSIASLDELETAGAELAFLLGWEKTRSIDQDVTRKVVRSRYSNSIYVRRKLGRTASCHFGRGLATGVFQTVIGENCESIETACEGWGHGYCELVTGAPGVIARMAESLPQHLRP